jgi:hypothetical protein
MIPFSRQIVSFSPLMFLAGCGMVQASQSEDEIKAEIAKLPHDRPGLWSAHEKITAFSVKGLPDSAEAGMRKEFEARGRLGQLRCLTPDLAAANHYEQLRAFGGGSCQVIAFHSDGTTYTGALQCNFANQASGSVEISGTGAGEVQTMAYAVDMVPIKGAGPSIFYAGNATVERTGDCPAK